MSPDRDLSPLFTWRSAIVDSDLSPNAKHVALTLSLHMNERGGSCFPSIDLQAEETGRGRSTVIRGLDELQERSYLRRTPPKKPGPGRYTVYEAVIPRGSHPDTHSDEEGPISDEEGPIQAESGSHSDTRGRHEDDKRALGPTEKEKAETQQAREEALNRWHGRNRAS